MEKLTRPKLFRLCYRARMILVLLVSFLLGASAAQAQTCTGGFYAPARRRTKLCLNLIFFNIKTTLDLVLKITKELVQ